MASNQPRSELKSGRLWLTIICGVCLLLFAGTICQIMWGKKDSLTGTEITSMMNVLLLIVSNVMTFYFSKNTEDSNKDKDRVFTVMTNSKNETEIKEVTDEPKIEIK